MIIVVTILLLGQTLFAGGPRHEHLVAPDVRFVPDEIKRMGELVLALH